MRQDGIGVGFRPGPLGAENMCFLLPAASLRARFRLPARLPEHRYRECQIDMDRLSSVKPDNFGGASDFSP